MNLALRILLSLTLVAALTPSARADEKPFPTSTVIVKDGGPYVVEDTVTIPRGVEVTLQQGRTILGRGAEPTLVVEGKLVVRGVTDNEGTIDGVRIVLARAFTSVRLDHVRLKQTEIRSSSDGPSSGKLQIESCDLDRRSDIDLRMSGGWVTLLRISTAAMISIEGVPAEGKKTCALVVNAGGCASGYAWEGLGGGLHVRGAKSVAFTRCRLGRKILLEDNGAVEIGLCKIDAERFVISHRDPRALRRVAISKCDLYGKLAILYPKEARGKARVTLDRCFFGGATDPAAIRDQLLLEIADPAIQTATLNFAKTKDRAVSVADRTK